jgi:sterol desaturase/sphingolipid hydroxylase (fatty acid hydroxylase superfamily)
MPESDIRLIRILGFGAALAIALLLQKVSPHSRTGGSLRVNGGLWVVNVVVTGTICGACVCAAAEWVAARNAGVIHWLSVPLWISIPASVLFLDFVSYGWHRANHVLPFLWRWHRVHHSDPSFTVSTSLRFHPGELVLSLPLRILAVVLLGAPVVAVVVFEVAFTLANSIVHGDIDLPQGADQVASRLFVTPALHRWHHTVVVPDRDRNFGTIFSIWDRLFGSYSPSDSRTTIQTGLPGLVEVGFGDALMMPVRGAGA